jgi:hypothetical protein
MRHPLIFLAVVGLFAAAAPASSVKISIGVRESGTLAPTGQDGGTTGGIEWVDRDAQTLTLDGTFQLFTFTFDTATLTPFAGATANGVWDTTRGALEHLRILNNEGITGPIILYIDDIVNTGPTGAPVVIANFDGFPTGVEAVFQEPSFSGSTSSNLATGSTSLVSDVLAFSAPNANRIEFQFVDDDPTRWIRLTTFNTPNIPNPAIDLAGSTLTLRIAGVIPEPGTVLLLGLGTLGLLVRRRKD